MPAVTPSTKDAWEIWVLFGGMTMRRVGLALLAAGCLAVASTTARADNDTVRLGSSSSGAVTNPDNGTDTELVVWRGGYRQGGHYGGFRGYGYRGYGYRGYGYRGYGYGYRGYGYGYGYRGYGYGGYNRPFYGSYYGGYYPSYYSGYYPGYYGGYCNQPYYWRISYSAPVTYVYNVEDAYVPVTSVYSAPASQAQYVQPRTMPAQQLPAPQVAPAQPNGNQTFPYDGGPSSPVPLPQVPNGSDAGPGAPPTVPLTGKIVSLPRETTAGSTQYTLVSSAAQQAAAAPAAAPSSYTYPAYGEQSLPPVRRTK
jgi:hypothetical protein